MFNNCTLNKKKKRIFLKIIFLQSASKLILHQKKIKLKINLKIRKKFFIVLLFNNLLKKKFLRKKKKNFYHWNLQSKSWSQKIYNNNNNLIIKIKLTKIKSKMHHQIKINSITINFQKKIRDILNIY